MSAVRDMVAVPRGAVFGWDVGGAHVKVCAVDASGAVLDVAQWACPLWQGLDHLEHTIGLVLERWPEAAMPAARHAVTMTGEMVDLFHDRAEGVREIAGTLARRLGRNVRFYANDAGWFTEAQCAAGWRSVASANWLATARWVATRVPDAVLVDIGSTTTDIVPIAGGHVAARATTDAGRLETGELVYQGVVRTPLCGVAHRIEFGDARVNVMNEWFATTADVYRVTGELEPLYDLHPSADHGPKTVVASEARLARMIGRDAHEATHEAWRRFALQWRELQLREIGANLARVVARVVASQPGLAKAPLVGAGCGRFLVAALARDEARSYIDFGGLAGVPEHCADWAATCAPSVAVALLASQGMAEASENTEEHERLRGAA